MSQTKNYIKCWEGSTTVQLMFAAQSCQVSGFPYQLLLHHHLGHKTSVHHHYRFSAAIVMTLNQNTVHKLGTLVLL